jgi:hypothetical protein
MGELAKKKKRKKGLPKLDIDASFEELNEKLKKAIKIGEQVEYVTQAYFSWIALNDLWQEPRIWVDEDGVIYEKLKDVGAKSTVVSVKPKYESQEAWIRELEHISPRFSRSTAYMRHRHIRQLMDELGRSFEEALRSVILSPGLTRIVRNSVLTEDGRLDEEAVRKLTEDSGRAKQLEDPREKVRAYMEDKEEDLEKGHATPQQVCKDIRTKVFGDHTIVLTWADGGPGDIRIFHEKPDGTFKEYYLLACDADGNPAMLPPAIKDLLERRLRLSR